MRRFARHARLWAGVALAGASLACALGNPTPAAWALTSSAPTASPPPALPPAARETLLRPTANPVIASPAPTPDQPLPGAPWVVFTDQAGSQLSIWDGSGGPARVVSLPGAALTGDLSAGLHPLAPWLALRTEDGENGLTLVLVDLAAGTIQEISPLLNDDLRAQSASETPPPAALVVSQPDALAWSPDGRALAFIAASAGPSADLYLYEPASGQVRRLTRGIRQAAGPFWSPDSRFVLVQELEQAPTEAGWPVTAVWAAATSGSDTRRLYTPPENSLGEVFLGWTGPETVATYTRTAGGGSTAREVPLNTRWLNPLFSGLFETLAFDPSSRQFLFSVREPLSGQAGLLPGVYRVAADTNSPEMVGVGEWTAVRWLAGQQVFLASGAQGALVVPPAGDGRLFQGEQWAVPAPDGHWIAGWGPSGVRLYDASGRLLEQVSGEPVDELTWQLDSQAVFFRSGASLYRSAFPTTRPELIGGEIGPAGYALVSALAP